MPNNAVIELCGITALEVSKWIVETCYWGKAGSVRPIKKCHFREALTLTISKLGVPMTPVPGSRASSSCMLVNVWELPTVCVIATSVIYLHGMDNYKLFALSIWVCVVHFSFEFA